MRLILVFCGLAAAAPVSAEVDTPAFLQSCRDLHQGRAGGATCEAMLEGALGAFSLLGADYMPLSAEMGYCLMPDMTATEAATAIVRYADRDPECAQLAHFSMCMNLAFQQTYGGSC